MSGIRSGKAASFYITGQRLDFSSSYRPGDDWKTSENVSAEDIKREIGKPYNQYILVRNMRGINGIVCEQLVLKDQKIAVNS